MSERTAPGVADSLRIALVLTGLRGGGSQRRMLTLAGEFLRQGAAVDVVVPTAEGTFRDRVPQGARIVALASWTARFPALTRRKSLCMLASLPMLARYLRRECPNVVLSSATPANLASLIAAREVPVVVCVNVPISHAASVRGRPLVGRLVRTYYPRAAAVITVSDALRTDTHTSATVPYERMVTVPSPIATAEIRRLATEPTQHPWFADGQPPVILGVGKLKPQKDFPTLIRALAEVRRTRTVRLVILGEGVERASLLHLAEELGVSRDVSLPGFVRNPYAFMARAAVFALTSRWEGFSNVAAEALACGCPTVATDCLGGVADFLRGYGELVPVGDAQALARALNEALDHPQPKEHLRARAEEFPVERASGRYLEILCACAANNR